MSKLTNKLFVVLVCILSLKLLAQEIIIIDGHRYTRDPSGVLRLITTSSNPATAANQTKSKNPTPTNTPDTIKQETQNPTIAQNKPETINDIFKSYGENYTWFDVLARVGVPTKCSVKQNNVDMNSPYLIATIDGVDSGVVGEKGIRNIYHIVMNKLVLRFTYDRFPLNNGLKDACQFNLFIKQLDKPQEDPKGYIVLPGGLLMNRSIDFLNLDKEGRKIFDGLDNRVFAGSGCFACHPNASLERDFKFNKGFWSANIDISKYENTMKKEGLAYSINHYMCYLTCYYSFLKLNYTVPTIQLNFKFYTTLQDLSKADAEQTLNLLDEPLLRCNTNKLPSFFANLINNFSDKHNVRYDVRADKFLEPGWTCIEKFTTKDIIVQHYNKELVEYHQSLIKQINSSLSEPLNKPDYYDNVKKAASEFFIDQSQYLNPPSQ